MKASLILTNCNRLIGKIFVEGNFNFESTKSIFPAVCDYLISSLSLKPPYVDPLNTVYGMYYEVIGDAASQAQFYLTDSVQHFLTGSLYFRAKPNYDSIYPSAVYIQNDIRVLMESLRWID